jgi:hypothetical protein
MIALTIVLVGLALIGFGVSSKRNADRVIAEVRAAEQRGIERERREQQYAANLAAKWVG